MIVDLTITAPGLLSLKSLFDFALELDVKIETKIVFAFHADKVISPFAIPRDILDDYIDDLIDYVTPRHTHKQRGFLQVLETMKKTPTFQERWPEDYKQGFYQGRQEQFRLDKLRKEKFTMSDIYSEDHRLFSWWTQP
jgi:hypothetical protein